MDTLQQMRIFVLTVRSGSFSKAGRQMDLSPATVTRYVQALEERYGVRLLNRSSRRLSLTGAGEVLMERASRMLQEYDEIEPAVADIGRGLRGRLHIHAREFIGHHLVVPLVAQFLTRHDDVDVVLTLKDRPLDLIENNIDVSIRTEWTGEVEHQSLVVRQLASWRRIVCASPSYLQRRGVPLSPEDLERHECLTYQFHQAPAVWYFRRNLQEQEVNVRSRVQTSSGESLQLLVLQGQGLALLPEWSVKAAIADGRLVALLEDFEVAPNKGVFRFNVYAVFQRARHQSPRLKSFLELMVARMRDASGMDPEA